MLAIKIWNFLRGYVIIRFEGLSLERLLNLALAKDIYLWNVKRISNLEIQATVSNRGYKDLEGVILKTGCDLIIEDRKGAPFILHKLKKRKMLGLGLLVFITIVLFLSSHIWEIEIIGAEQTPKENIISILEENNIRLGKLKKNLDKDNIKKILYEEFDYFSFLDIRIKGVKLILELKEQDLAPEIVDKNYPCHIVAKNKGVIIKVVAKNGVTMVEQGEIVNEGQILISGVVPGLNNESSFLVHSEGEVLAQTRYTVSVEEPIIKTEKRETGKLVKQRGLKIKDKGIRFITGEIPFNNYMEEINENKIINLKWPKIDFPIRFIEYIYREVEIIEVKQEIEYLKKHSQLKAINEINKSLPEDGEVISKDVIHSVVDNILKTKVIIEVIEDIGKKRIISN